jgi:hypothetical protein
VGKGVVELSCQPISFPAGGQVLESCRVGGKRAAGLPLGRGQLGDDEPNEGKQQTPGNHGHREYGHVGGRGFDEGNRGGQIEQGRSHRKQDDCPVAILPGNQQQWHKQDEERDPDVGERVVNAHAGSKPALDVRCALDDGSEAGNRERHRQEGSAHHSLQPWPQQHDHQDAEEEDAGLGETGVGGVRVLLVGPGNQDEKAQPDGNEPAKDIEQSGLDRGASHGRIIDISTVTPQ